MARLYNEIDCRDDLSHLLGTHNWLLMMAAIPQLLYNAAECSLEPDSYCSEELDILVSSLEQLQARIPGATVVLNAINRLRTSRNSGRIQNTTTTFESREKVFFSEGYDILSYRELFPFPNSLSPRLSLWELYAGHTFQEGGPPPAAPDDLSRIFEEFSDLSRFTFSGVPHAFS